MAKSEKMLLLLEPEERQAFQEASRIAGLNLSAWIRERLRLAAIRELESAGRPIAFIAPIPLGGSDD
ncbi:MAG: hypothetical protein NTY36_00430 [Deltaproteobacteria bacterium]|nr:hypothetical protein [Deltaproteobacteria bacterium]